MRAKMRFTRRKARLHKRFQANIIFCLIVYFNEILIQAIFIPKTAIIWKIKFAPKLVCLSLYNSSI